MFEILPASRSRSLRPWPQALASTLAHGALGVAAIAATSDGVATVATGITQRTMIFVEHPPAPPPPAAIAEPLPATTIPAGPVFEAVTAPIDVPVALPPIDLGERFDPTRFLGRGTEVPPGTPVETGPDATTQGQLWHTEEVDEPVDLRTIDRPRYPALLQQAGVEGHVEVRFVVDTLGRVEAASVTVLGSSHPAFEPPVLAALGTARYRPARVRGAAVRQLVLQRFGFRLER